MILVQEVSERAVHKPQRHEMVINRVVKPQDTSESGQSNFRTQSYLRQLLKLSQQAVRKKSADVHSQIQNFHDTSYVRGQQPPPPFDLTQARLTHFRNTHSLKGRTLRAVDRGLQVRQRIKNSRFVEKAAEYARKKSMSVTNQKYQEPQTMFRQFQPNFKSKKGCKYFDLNLFNKTKKFSSWQEQSQIQPPGIPLASLQRQPFNSELQKQTYFIKYQKEIAWNKYCCSKTEKPSTFYHSPDHLELPLKEHLIQQPPMQLYNKPLRCRDKQEVLGQTFSFRGHGRPRGLVRKIFN